MHIHIMELYILSTALSAALAQSVDRPSQAVGSSNPRVVCCDCRHALLVVDKHVFWEVFKSDSEFISDPNFELLVYFSLWGSLLIYKEVYCPH